MATRRWLMASLDDRGESSAGFDGICLSGMAFRAGVPAESRPYSGIISIPDDVRVRSGQVGLEQAEARDRLRRGTAVMERPRSTRDSGENRRRTSISGD